MLLANLACHTASPLLAGDENDDGELPEFGSALLILATNEKVTRTAATFPSKPLSVFRSALHPHGNIERAVNSLLNYRRGNGSCCWLSI